VGVARVDARVLEPLGFAVGHAQAVPAGAAPRVAPLDENGRAGARGHHRGGPCGLGVRGDPQARERRGLGPVRGDERGLGEKVPAERADPGIREEARAACRRDDRIDDQLDGRLSATHEVSSSDSSESKTSTNSTGPRTEPCGTPAFGQDAEDRSEEEDGGGEAKHP